MVKRDEVGDKELGMTGGLRENRGSVGKGRRGVCILVRVKLSMHLGTKKPSTQLRLETDSIAYGSFQTTHPNSVLLLLLSLSVVSLDHTDSSRPLLSVDLGTQD